MSEKIKVNVNGKEVIAENGTRLSDILNMEKPCGGHGTCGKCRVTVNGREELACRYVITHDVYVGMREVSDIVSEAGIEESRAMTDKLCFVLDIGTTTLALALVSLDSGKTVRVVTAVNPQRRFGADVMTRIEYCMKNSVAELQGVLVEEINRMISEMGVEELDTVYVSANVTMLHTLFGEDCSTIGVAPYTPVFLDGRTEKASFIGIHGVKNIASLPSVSSFIGADIVAGMNLIGMPDEGKYFLLLDLGTNAEIALFSRRSAVATAAAAGPCFEGANISCGMSAMPGAVCSFELNYGHSFFKTVDDGKAEGICGTGLVDIIAELLKNGIIDETGYMDGVYTVSEGVYLSSDDVRQYQLAKSAIYSAILALMHAEGVTFEDIQRMYVSGGFSSKLNAEKAVVGGLIPRELAHRITVLNNSSLGGAVKYACGERDIKRFIKNTRYADLSSDPYFLELFMQNMMFE